MGVDNLKRGLDLNYRRYVPGQGWLFEIRESCNRGGVCSYVIAEFEDNSFRGEFVLLRGSVLLTRLSSANPIKSLINYLESSSGSVSVRYISRKSWQKIKLDKFLDYRQSP